MTNAKREYLRANRYPVYRWKFRGGKYKHKGTYTATTAMPSLVFNHYCFYLAEFNDAILVSCKDTDKFPFPDKDLLINGIRESIKENLKRAR